MRLANELLVFRLMRTDRLRRAPCQGGRGPRWIVDDALVKRGLERRIAVRVPFFAIVPYIIETSQLLAVVGERIGHRLATTANIKCYPLPFEVERWNVSAIWTRHEKPDEALSWLVTMLRQASAVLQP